MRLVGQSRSKSRSAASIAVLAMVFALLQAAGTQRAAADTTTASPVKSTVSAAVKAAKASGSAVEVGSLRGESSETYANADGSFTSVQHLRPVRTRRDGKWIALDSTLQRGTDGVVRPVASSLDIQIEGGEGPFLRMGLAGRTLSLSWPTPLPEPALEGDTARFVDALPGVDLLVRADVDGVSHTLVVKSRDAAANPELAKLTFGLGGSLSVRDDDASGLRAMDEGSGGAVLEAPTPLMWDSRGSSAKAASASGTLAEGPAEGSAVAEVEAGVADGAMTLTPDQGLLTGPATVYPVYIDPQWSSPKDSAWAMVSSGYPTTSYYKFDGKSTEGVGLCEVSKDASCVKDQKKRLFFRMPTSTFAGKSILSADFTAYETHAYNCDNPTVVELWHTKGFITSSTWNSTSDNWLDKVDSRDVAHCTSTPVEFNVKSTIADVASSHSSTVTFGLRAYSESSMTWWKRFADEAYLQVNYNNPPNQPDNGDSKLKPGGNCVGPADAKPENDTTPTMYAVLSDPDHDAVAAQFKVGWDTDGDGAITGQWTSATTSSKSSGSQFEMSVPASVDIPQKTLAGWSVRAWDGHNWGPWNYAGSATSCYFTVDTGKPDPPSVTSADYPASNPDDPNDPWIDGVGRYGTFTIDSAASDVTRYEYSLNDGEPGRASPSAPGGPVTVQVAPSKVGPNSLEVQAFDAAGNGSTIGVYTFRVAAGSAAKAAWALDEPDGSAQVGDTSGNHPADLHGGVTLGVDGVSGKAMQLNGTDGYVSTSGPVLDDTSKSFSVSAWAKLPTEKPSHAAIIATQAGTTRSGFELYYSHDYDRWVFNRYDADTTTSSIVRALSNEAPQGGEWAHLVGVYDAVAQTLALYVNGDLQGRPVPYTQPWDANGAVQIGAGWHSGLNSFFSGDIDDVRIFDRIITGDEVKDLVAEQPLVAARWTLNDDGDEVPAATAYYKLDEAAGASRAEDTTGTYPAGAHGGVTFGEAGEVGAAAGFDGSTGYAATSGAVVDTSGSFSVSAWVKLAAKPTDAVQIVTQRGTSCQGFGLYYSQYYDRWIFNRRTTDSGDAAIVRAQSETVPQTGVWTHLVGAYDAANHQLRLYVNGTVEGTQAYTATAWAATGPLQIGAGWCGSPRDFFDGSIDDVRLFNRALTGSQAAVLAAGSPQAVTADDGPHGHHATLHGNAFIDQSSYMLGTGALNLDGDGDYADTAGPVVDTSQSFTVAGWVTSAGVPDHKVAVFSQAGAVNSGFVLRFDPSVAGGAGGYQIEMPDADTSGASRPTADDTYFRSGGDWDHVAIVYDALRDEMRLYVNGQMEQAEENVSYRFNVIGFNATQTFQIGRAKTGGTWGEYWPGVIDDVWAYNGVLTDDQIQNLADPFDELPTEPGP